MSDARPTILVINVGWEQRPLVEMARRYAGRLVGINPNAAVPAELGLDRLEIVDVRDTARILEIAREENISAVVADECDYSAYAAALVAEALNLPGAGLGPAGRAVNKLLQRQALADAGIHQPQYRLCIDTQQALAAADHIGYPVVVKPVDSRGGMGVRFVHGPKEMADAVINAIGSSISWLVLVEEFIHGTQLVVDGYVFPKAGYQALSISSKRMIAQSHVAADIVTPAEVDPGIIKAVRDYDAQVVAAMGLRHGMTHSEYMVDSQGQIHLVEIANRGGGVWISARYVPAVCGIDTTEQLVLDALGNGRDLYQDRGGIQGRAGRVHFLVPPKNQTVSAVLGQDAAAAVPGVEALWVKSDFSRQTQNVTDDRDRMGMAILSGDTPEAVEQTLTNLLQALRVAE